RGERWLRLNGHAHQSAAAPDPTAAEEQLAAVRRPRWAKTACRRNLPLPDARERLNVHLGLAGLARLIGDPFAVGRNGTTTRTAGGHDRFGFSIPDEREEIDDIASVIGEPSAIARTGARPRHRIGRDQLLLQARAVDRFPKEMETAIAARGIDHAAAIRRPHG